MAALQVVNEVLLARGQAVPAWLCKSGCLQASRTARLGLGSARPEPVPVDLLVWPQPAGLRHHHKCALAAGGLCSVNSWSCTSVWEHGLGWPCSRPRGGLDAEQTQDTGKKTNPLSDFRSVLVSVWSLLISML